MWTRPRKTMTRRWTATGGLCTEWRSQSRRSHDREYCLGKGVNAPDVPTVKTSSVSLPRQDSRVTHCRLCQCLCEVVRRNRYSAVFSRGVAVPRTQRRSSCTGTLQLYRDTPAGHVSGAKVAAGGKMGPVYIYRHPLLLR